MKKTLKTQFIKDDRSFDSEKAIESGHDARTTAIKDFAAWFSLAIKAIAYRGETQKV
ncbi:hypothetical protein LP7551_01907 [Roseibium album]|nr:hypothetical protein LP7551_01907 [Roseibium album]